MRSRPSIILFLFLIVLELFPSGLLIAGDKDCRSCHSGEGAKELGLKDVYKEIDSYRFQHPGVRDRCGDCHIAKGLKEASVKRWKAGSFDYTNDQVFRIEGLSPGREYLVEISIVDRGGNKSDLPPHRVVPSRVKAIPYEDSTPPVIKGVTVEEIRQGIFMEATIRWETDELSSSLVECGLTPKFGEKIGSEKVFTTIHRIRIPGLAKGKRYHCRILSRDLFGNLSTYGGLTIDTSREVKRIRFREGKDRIPPNAGEPSFFRLGGGEALYVRVTADEDVKATLFVTESVEMGKHGFGLLPARESHIDACIRCHPKGVSHPVGIRSKLPTTRIPPDLPTIEGGVITCVTCHHPHGGNRRYFARMDIKRDLCITCHIERRW